MVGRQPPVLSPVSSRKCIRTSHTEATRRIVRPMVSHRSTLRPMAANGMALSELARYLVVSQQNMDGVLKRLERDQHVKRIPDARDRRARKVVLTPQGRAFWTTMQPDMYKCYEQAFTELKFDEKFTPLNFLSALNAVLCTVEVEEDWC
jgi:DNA-binding MarR family transcriptional regulator